MKPRLLKRRLKVIHASLVILFIMVIGHYIF